MKIKLFSLVTIALMLSGAAFVGAQDSSTYSIQLSFQNLADPGQDHYEGWLIVDGQPKSTGKFTMDNGNIMDLDGKPISNFTVNFDASSATKFVLTLEPMGDTDSTPAAIKPVAGMISDNMANLKQNTGVDFSSGISGDYILATPTNGANTNENSGIWWLDPSGGTKNTSLNLPDLSGTDWIYEGWVVVDGMPITSGTFDNGSMADNSAPYSADQPSPPFPGEDYLMNPPSGITFPTDLSGGKAVISIEPRMDNSPAPFQFKPLVGDIPMNAADHTLYSVSDMSASLPTGMLTISEVMMSGTDSMPVSGLAIILSMVTLAAIPRFRKKFD